MMNYKEYLIALFDTALFKKMIFLRNNSYYTDPVPPSTTYKYNSSFHRAQFSQLNNFSFYDSFDESRTVYLV